MGHRIFLIAVVIAAIHGSTNADETVCDWSTLNTCLTPMASVANNPNWAEKCPIMKVGKECLEKLEAVCTDQSIINTIDTTMSSLETALDHCAQDPANPGEPVCDWPSLNTCIGPLSAMANNTNMAEICPIMKVGKECLEKLEAVCTDQSIINTIDTTMSSLETALDHCAQDPANPGEPVCDWPSLNTCIGPLSAMANNTNMAEICPIMKVGKECLVELRPLCTEPTIIQTIDNTMTGLDTSLPYCPQDPANPGEPVCDWPSLNTCIGPMKGMGNNTNMAEICPIMKEVKECLIEMKPFCTDPTVTKLVNSTMSNLDLSLPYCPQGSTGSTNDDELACDWPSANICLGPMAILANSKNVTQICPVIQEGKECLTKIKPLCTDEALIDIVDKTLINLGYLMPLCIGECTWVTVHICTEPLVQLERETNTSRICPTMANGINCLKHVSSNCTDNTMMTSVSTSLSETKDAWTKSCTGDCTWPILSKCNEIIAQVFKEEDVGNICPTAFKAQDCLEDMMPSCTYDDLSNHVRGTLAEVYKGNSKSCEGACTWTTFSDCNKPLAGFTWETPLETSCPVMKRSKACMLDLLPFCKDGKINSTTLEAVSGLDKILIYCPGDTTPGHLPTHPHFPTTPKPYPTGYYPTPTGRYPTGYYPTPTGRYPTGSYPTGSYPTPTGYYSTWPYPSETHRPAMEPLEACDWPTFERCISPTTKISESEVEVSLDWMCPIMETAKRCLMDMMPHCHDELLKTTTQRSLNGVVKGMGPCHGGSTGENEDCTWDTYHHCSDMISTMWDNFEGDHDKVCRDWMEAKTCFGTLYEHCDPGSLRGLIENAIESNEHRVSFCKSPGKCDDWFIDDCLKHVKVHDSEDYMPWEDQCREGGAAKHCLEDLRDRCSHEEVHEQIEKKDMPWLNEFIEKCMMYGHETGTGSYTGDGQVRHPSDGPSAGSHIHPSTSTFGLLTIVTLTFAMWTIRG